MRFFLKTILILVATSCLLAEEVSGPKVGSELKPLKVFAAAGLVSGEEKDFAEVRKDDSTYFVFVQASKFDRPVARFLKKLDTELAATRPDVQVIAVWLTDDLAKSKEYLPRMQESIQLRQTVLAVYGGEKTGPQDWSIDSAKNVTVVLASGGKIVASTGYGSINETIVPESLKQLPKK